MLVVDPAGNGFTGLVFHVQVGLQRRVTPHGGAVTGLVDAHSGAARAAATVGAHALEKSAQGFAVLGLAPLPLRPGEGGGRHVWPQTEKTR